MVASTGIAATLLEGGMTAHRKFMLPNNMKHDQLSTVFFHPSDISKKAETWRKTSELLSDGAPTRSGKAVEDSSSYRV